MQGGNAKAPFITHDDGFYRKNKRVTDGIHPVASHLCKSHRSDYDLRCVERKCRQPGFCGTGILTEVQGAEILECVLHLERRLNGPTPKSDLLATRNADVVAKRHAVTRQEDQKPPHGENRKDTDPGASWSSASEMPDLVTVEVDEEDDTIGKTAHPIFRIPPRQHCM